MQAGRLQHGACNIIAMGSTLMKTHMMMYTLNTLKVTLDKSIYQMHKNVNVKCAQEHAFIHLLLVYLFIQLSLLLDGGMIFPTFPEQTGL